MRFGLYILALPSLKCYLAEEALCALKYCTVKMEAGL